MSRSALLCAAAGLALMPGLASADTPSFFDVFTELSMTDGGHSSNSAGVRAGHLAGAFVGDADIGMGWNGMRLNGLPPGTPVTGTLRASDSGGGPGSPGPNSFFDVFVDFAAPPQPMVSFFDVFADFSDIGSPAKLNLHKPVQAQFSDSFFDVFVEIDLPNSMIQKLELHGVAAPGGHIMNGGTRAGSTVDSFFDVFFDISFDRGVGSGERQWSMTMTGSQVPAPGALGTLGLLAFARRRARR